ncbi:MAG: Peptidyl-dipeptidase A precursor, partial [uncultured Gemmatimonadaceae bacterium]
AGEPGLVGGRDLHHRRHRGALGRRPGALRRGRAALRHRRPPLRPRAARPGAAAQARPAAALARRPAAGRPRRGGRAHATHRGARGVVREGELLPPRQARRAGGRRRARHELLSDQRPLARDGHEPPTRRAARRLARVAHGVAADAAALRALRGAVEPGRARAGLRRRGGDVALELRHAARRVREGAGAALGAGAPALRLAARLRAHAPQRAVRRRRGAEGRDDPGAPARQHVGAGVGERLPRGRAPQRGAHLRPHGAAQGQAGGRARDGALRRALLHLAGLRLAAGDVLGALADHQAARPRGGVPRERVGHRQQGRPAHQDVHRGHRRRLRDGAPRARAQLLPARLQGAAAAVPERRERRLPRGDRRRDRALDHAGLPREGGPPGPGAERRGRHRAPAPAGARQGGVPPLRPAHRPVAVAAVLGGGEAGRLQQVVVGAAEPVPGRGRAGGAQRGRLRRRGQVPRAGQHPVHALLPRAGAPVPAPPRALPRGRLHGPAQPLLHLRQQGRGRQARDDARGGAEPPLAGDAPRRHRRAPHGRRRDARVLRPAQEVARRAEQGEAGGVGRGAAHGAAL